MPDLTEVNELLSGDFTVTGLPRREGDQSSSLVSFLVDGITNTQVEQLLYYPEPTDTEEATEPKESAGSHPSSPCPTAPIEAGGNSSLKRSQRLAAASSPANAEGKNTNVKSALTPTV